MAAFAGWFGRLMDCLFVASFEGLFAGVSGVLGLIDNDCFVHGPSFYTCPFGSSEDFVRSIP